MRVFEVEFDPMWPVPSGLLIAAETLEEAMAIAHKTVKHTEVKEVNEVNLTKPGVIFYESGDY